jgi:hypothetical protein
MHVSPFLRKGIVYIPTSRQIPGSYSLDTEPVQVALAADIAALCDAFERAIEIGNPSIAEADVPTFANWVTVARTGVKSWAAFDRGALSWSLNTDLKTGEYRMHSYVPLMGGGWTQDRVPIFTLPADTPIPEVARRAAAVLSDAAKLQSQSV